MSQYQSFLNCSCKPMLAGNSIDISLAGCMDSEIQADIVLKVYDTLRFWGQIKSCKGYPIENAFVRLVRVVHSCKGGRYEDLAHTVSDCNGYYQFDLCMADPNGCYQVLVDKCDPIAETVGSYNYSHKPRSKCEMYAYACEKPHTQSF